MGAIAGTPDGSRLPRGGATSGRAPTPRTVPSPGGGLDRIGETGGRIAGGALGGVIGGALGGPVGAWIGRGIGSRVGGAAGRGAVAAGRAAAGALADMMATANESAEEETRDQEGAIPCENCAEIPCFNPKDGWSQEQLDEFRKQLQEQEDTINEMEPTDLLRNMDRYRKAGRGTGDPAARAKQRELWISNETERLTELYEDQHGIDEAERMAAEQAKKNAKTLDAVHDVDLVAGGSGNVSGMGDSSVNRSIGSQWSKKNRVGKLRKHAEGARDSGRKMNVKLIICDDDAADKGADSPTSPSAPSPEGASPGSGDAPMS